MKQLKLSFLLCLITIVTFAQTAQRGEQNPPAPGIGIVIKKNPGGGASKAVVTNENGQANITIKEAGNYTIVLTQTQGKTAGEPIPNLIIKGGKNPGGKMMTVTTNEKGEAQLKDLEKGDYTFTVEQPASTDIKVLEKIKEREERFAKSDEVDGHVTLLKKNGEKARTTMTTTTSTDYVGHVTLLRFSQLYVGGGLQMPSSTTKEGANSVNGIDLNIGYYQPIWAWEKSMISLGINAELGYRQGIGSHNLDNQYTIYNLAGQSQLPTTTERGIGPPGKEPGFRGAAGLQLNVHLGNKFTLSPIINAGYLSTTHKSFSVTETVYYNGSEYNYDLLSQKESKTSGLGILPKLRMTYNITPRIGIWLEGNYTMGPKIKTETTRFVPWGNADVNGAYDLAQFYDASYVTTKKETSYSAMGVNGGIVFSLGKPKGDKPTVGTLNPPPTTNPNPPLSTPTTSGGTVPTKSLQKPIKRSVPRWGRHTTDINGCERGGVFCLKNRLFTENIKLESDESINETTVELIDNTILVKLIAIESNISSETIDDFRKNKVSLENNIIPIDILNEWLSSINLPTQKKSVNIKKEDRKYLINETFNKDKKVSIIESYENATINIDGKEYNLKVITTSERGTGSPRSQGF